MRLPRSVLGFSLNFLAALLTLVLIGLSCASPGAGAFGPFSPHPLFSRFLCFLVFGVVVGGGGRRVQVGGSAGVLVVLRLQGT